jgi:HlyD family secretion protein
MRYLPALFVVTLLAAGGALYARQAGPQEPSPVHAPPPASPGPRGVSALGRLEPKDGVRRVAGPSLPSAVVQELLVDEGDAVSKGQLLATIDTAEVRAAAVREVEAELVNAQREYARSQQLNQGRAESDSNRDEWKTRVAALDARRERAEAELRLAQVRAPIDGRVLDVHARPGERIGPDGILELGDTNAMYAIAEVYETDIGRVTLGQRARVTSPALPEALTGRADPVSPRRRR